MKSVGFFCLGLLLFFGPLLLIMPMMSDPASNGGAVCGGLVAIVLLIGWLYLGVAGWDSQAQPVAKGIGVLVMLLIPLVNFVAVYWIGRGAVRLASRVKV